MATKTTPEPLEIGVKGMTCAACVRRVESKLRKLPDVAEASVNLATERATIRLLHPPQPDDLATIKAAVRKLGYEPVELNKEASGKLSKDANEDTRALWRNFLGSATFALPLLVLAMVPMLSDRIMISMMRVLPMEQWNWIMFGLALPVQFYFGWQFMRLGFKSLVSLAPDMNSLVLIGTASAFAYSTLVVLWPELIPPESRHVYFEASAVVITLVLLGKFLETRSRRQAADSMKLLLNLVPRSATVIKNGQSQTISVDQVELNDLLEVPPGSAIAVDGIVESGSTYIDESMVTGEPLPVIKQAGDTVVAGTLNTNGTIQFRATAIGADTTLAKIVAFVQSAQSTKPRIQNIADQVVAYFVPVVLVVALITALAWLVAMPGGSLDQALIHAVAVLIIACPCAMGLAVPTSIMVGTGTAARLGILFRSTEAVQSLSEITAVAFDKTGTLTVGKPELITFEALAPFGEDTLLAQLAIIERRSEHPLATAVVRASEQRQLSCSATVVQFQAIAGAGVEATLDSGESFLIGSEKLLRERSIDMAQARPLIDRVTQPGHSYFLTALNGKLAGVMVIADTLKAGAVATVSELQQQGFEVSLISGDNMRTAQSIAAELGIESRHVSAEVRPNDKAQVIQSLQQRGRKVAFVGDGLNDAPALTVADVGIAMGTGTDLAVESADVIAMSGDIANIPRAIVVARAVMSNIHQNLAWAFGYNILLIPLATGLLKPWIGFGLSPMLAGAAMSLSSFFVVANALRLSKVDLR